MHQEYTFARNGVEEVVKPERWGWGVEYKDGTELHQFDAEGKFHQFREIDQENVVMFVMYKLDDPTKRVDLIVSGNVQYFHVYKRMILNASTEEETRPTVILFGYKNKDTGETSYHYIFPDDHILVSNYDCVDLPKYIQ